MMTDVAQPTPDRTESASAGQFRAQAPHSMQASRSAMRALPFSSSKTACGQTLRHIPQPVHFASSSLKVTTSGRYRSSAITVLRPPSHKPSDQPERHAHDGGGRLERHGHAHLAADA